MKKGFAGLIMLLIGGLILAVLSVYTLQRTTLTSVEGVDGEEITAKNAQEKVDKINEDYQKKTQEYLNQ